MVPPAPAITKEPWLAERLRAVPGPRHLITDAAAAEPVPSAFAEICMFFHLINSVYIQLISAY